MDGSRANDGAPLNKRIVEPWGGEGMVDIWPLPIFYPRLFRRSRVISNSSLSRGKRQSFSRNFSFSSNDFILIPWILGKSVSGGSRMDEKCVIWKRDWKEGNRDCNYLFKFSFTILCNLIAGIRIRNGEDRYWSYFFPYIYIHMWKNLNDDEFGLKKWSVWKG